MGEANKSLLVTQLHLSAGLKTRHGLGVVAPPHLSSAVDGRFFSECSSDKFRFRRNILSEINDTAVLDLQKQRCLTEEVPASNTAKCCTLLYTVHSLHLYFHFECTNRLTSELVCTFYSV